MSIYHYIQTENNPPLYTVGTGHPKDKTWEPDSDHTSRDDAAARVCFLNGGNDPAPAPLPASGAVKFTLPKDVPAGVSGYRCSEPGDLTGDYYPAQAVAELVAALKNAISAFELVLPVALSYEGKAPDEARKATERETAPWRAVLAQFEGAK